MSLSQVRTYFNQEIIKVSPDRSEWRDAFNIENVPRTLLNKRYHIDTTSVASSPQSDHHVEDNFAVTVTIWKQGFNEVATALDELLDEAHCIRMQLINPRNVNDFAGDIDRVDSVSIEPTAFDDSNDNIVQMDMIFNVVLFFGTT